MRKIVLSICIPTFNRIEALKELVDLLLSVENSAFEIVITDNCSTDGTEEIITCYTDKRIRYIRNKQPLPALVNMIHSIFNAKGKYALYCNDRDILYPQKINSLINMLSETDLAFVMCPRNAKGTEDFIVFDKGYDSLIHQKCIHHPTGMVFNRDLMEKHLIENDYSQYQDVIYTYDFLMLDLLQYGKSAICNLGYWGPRKTTFLRNHRSGTGQTLYFMPETRSRTFEKIVKHIFQHNKYNLTQMEKLILIDNFYSYFAKLFCNYKLCLSDKNESAHYGINRKNVSLISMIKIYSSFFDESLLKMGFIFTDNMINQIRQKKLKYLWTVIICCIKIDLLSLWKFFQR